MDYTRLSLADVGSALLEVARDAQSTFGGLDVRQLNWRPDAARWSVAQCLQHLLTGNRLMLEAAADALRAPRRTLWQRLPVLPRVLGRLLIRSQAPGTARRYTAPLKARPTTDDIPLDVVRRFVDQHGAAADWLRTLDEAAAARTIMVSPFIRVVTYSILDGCRLVVAHDWRHVEQARRVLRSPHFPAA